MKTVERIDATCDLSWRRKEKQYSNENQRTHRRYSV